MKKKIIIDTDPAMGTKGGDPEDCFAIMLALNSPEIEVLGITTVQGNVPVERGYSNAKFLVEELNKENLIAFKYCDQNGKIEEQFNPNGSIKNIAGIFNKEKNVLGMMPHPERMIDNCLSGEDGSIFFNNLINNLK